ncbi:tRNA pseudouridine(55) synthase TruB [Streptococcus sp. CSL10205-OR2]|uniref:tRNA pseudouridine(55) synthase TruB n=1 Tax=Streptococcus sp. CSL10205-OR2 TaxID=2980558 RepID=UPI0021DAA31D|nr:tRNA pseudouridine(55) synthase TruB [Streptococcus sp. CSL10205-OR2]MCU9533306.1 tRNA pseudouridine(55) synthase TruB [Streptococcus sp. CSL10205-OR2]
MISGIINLKKVAGMTSHDAVFKLRKILNEKKIGHGGTLDPDVTGVLPIAVGKATRVIEFMTDSGKVYEGEVTLGFSTTTEDSSGEVVDRSLIHSNELTEEKVDIAMKSFIGEIEQVPPMYSAVKVNGKKLYEYARNGETVERPKRQVTIFEFVRTSPLSFKEETCSFSFRVNCSKGTYVRTLAVDLGNQLGYASHMSFLTRTSAAGLNLLESLTLEEIAEKVTQEDYSFLLPMTYGVSDLPRVELTEGMVTDISHGRFIQLPHNKEMVLAAFYDNQLIAILESRDYLYKPRKVLI